MPILTAAFALLIFSSHSYYAGEQEAPPGQIMLRHYHKSYSKADAQVASSLGQILLLQDSDAQPPLLELVFDEEYGKIRRLPIAARVEFFWELVLHVPLGHVAHFSEEIAETAHADCGKELAAKITAFLSGAQARTAPPQVIEAVKSWGAPGLLGKPQ